MQSKDIRQNWINFFTDKSRGHLHLPSASLVPNNPTLLLTNAGMVPFVPYFLGQQTPPASRVATVQKCVRVGGKDSDLENIGKTPRHLTFFEMLGNFSFGDYFKEEVICWAWELLTQVYGFKPEELIVSVFEGDDASAHGRPEHKVAFDQEAFDIWHKKIGIPESRIWRLGRSDNFWGPPGGISGPCGPCSEIYYAPPDGSEPIEIWNLVFMQYEKFEDGSLKALAKPNIDTGAGLERMATILQGKQNVFETDLLLPIMRSVKISGAEQSNPEVVLATKIIADHLRCSSMLLADGVRPSNLGRGYILRMLIRRAARFGRLIGLNEPFLQTLVPSVQEVFAEAYPELDQNVELIKKEVQSEEEAFNNTIERGLKKFHELITNIPLSVDGDGLGGNQNTISGEEAFDLYATYGFPVELTIDLAKEKGLTVDLEGYEKAKQAHSEISNQGKFSVGFKVNELNDELKDLPATDFISKHSSEHFKAYCNGESEKAKILKIIKAEDEDIIVLDRTIFYAEGGGQLYDTGYIATASGEKLFDITNVQKINEVIVHKGKLIDNSLQQGNSVLLIVDSARREDLEQHHTATHLLHAVLRLITNNEAEQKGSLVAPDRLRFDFTCSKKLSDDKLEQVENLVNSVIEGSTEVKHETMSKEEATKKGALAFFGDKYGDKVKVLSIIPTNGENEAQSPLLGGWRVKSVELCGGTHVKNTSEIQGFKIISEAAVSAGIRRIEAVAGQAYINYLRESDKQLDELKHELKVPREKVSERIKEVLENEKQKDKKITELQKQLVKFESESLIVQVVEKNGIEFLISETSSTSLKETLDYVSSKIQGEYILFLAAKTEPKMSYAAKVSKNAGTTAKDLVAKFAALVGGSGGGRPDFAQGGGGEVTKIAEALNEIKKQVEFD